MLGINQDTMAYFNRIAAMAILYKEKKISKKLLAKKLNLSIPTISNIVKDLERKGYLSSTGKLEHSYGQHQGYWSIAPEKDTFLCFQVSPFEIKCIIVDACMLHITSLEIEETNFSNIKDIVDNIIKKIKEKQELYPSITKVAIATHGVVDYNTGVSIMMPRLINKEIYPIKEKIENEINLPVRVDNSCNIFALAEKWLGSGDQYEDFMWINLDRGIGGAIVFNNSIYRGHSFMAGELGHLEVKEDGPLCTCGLHGCLEAMINKQIIVNLWTDHYGVNADFDNFLEAVECEDPKAIEIVSMIAYYLYKGLASVIGILNPQHIFLGGSLAHMGEPFLKMLQQNLNSPFVYQEYYKHHVSFSTISEEDLIASCSFLWIEEELRLDKRNDGTIK